MSRRKRRTYSEEFKLQMVSLYTNGKPRVEIIREYELTPSTFDKWISSYNNSNSFKSSENLTADQKRIIELEKELKQSKMETDILKQAALIMSRK